MADFDLAGSGAVLSECGTYRYRLDRHVGAGDLVYAFFGINPSTADASLDDATVRKWRGFSERLGAARFIVGNVFAYRATDVSELRDVADPVGPEWGKYTGRIISEADIIVPCWGSRGKLKSKHLCDRLDVMVDALWATGKPLMCWGETASGDPIHPLMLGYKTPLVALSRTNGKDQ